ncbi:MULTISPECIES: tryptophan 2,3-dioxygenase family protein [unclassified Sinorhizobium]|uniref:tryptophan 2,3-dioxygenase n=1 Tax=unclassified Sinorhizobium TaxID=2613772 RepID=UPI0024C2DF08|nr:MULTISPECIES: tryptophan 2,3-dioxygenase family protein [unclassified Sinorhizobium]MDK1373768.1 tryptophan 2,3-dioxygenase family protein [Sinorhizobium sp. 6-70]MDK1478731.1 tryptophan 2,3-dioxygenase family protein [Sinorhizobium sp. 6-117]
MLDHLENRNWPQGTPEGHTPYSAWLKVDELHALQQPVGDHPGEYGFIVTVHISELCWMLIIREIEAAQRQLREDKLSDAIKTLKRVVSHHAPLNATWKSISWMTPADLLAMLSMVVEKHGQDTALQGCTYRRMVYLLGIKQAHHLQHFEPQPHRWQELKAVLESPGLYDDVLAYLNRRGKTVSASVLDRDFSQPYQPSKDVEKIWRDIYSSPEDEDLCQLGEVLTDIAEEFTNWKYHHLMATRRTFGQRAAYFGEEGISWLTPTLEEFPFPELWSARTCIGDPPVGCPHHKA